MLQQLTFHETLPATLHEFFTQRLSNVTDAAKLLIVLDPGGRLALGETVTRRAQVWRVVRYAENDLAFRKEYSREGRVLVWVAGRHESNEKSLIEVSSLTDVFRQADDILDCSLTGALSNLVPNETFPLDPVLEHASIIANHLGRVAGGVKELRPHLPPLAALDANLIRALVLSAIAPKFEPRIFLFRAETASRVLQQYAKLAWGADWSTEGQSLLQTQARQASQIDLGEMAGWFDTPTDGLARFVYLYRFLSRAGVQNVMNQIRGLGVLGFDPQPLERGMETMQRLWERDVEWRKRFIRQAEESLTTDDIRRTVDLVTLDSPPRALDILGRVETPALLYEVGMQLVRVGRAQKKLPAAMNGWRERRPNLLDMFQENDTPHVRAAVALTTLLDQMSLILACLRQDKASATTLPELLKWYVDGRFYEMEYAHAQAARALNRLPADQRSEFVKPLKELRGLVRTFLDQADHALGRTVAADWTGFLGSKQLSTNVLWDFVKTPRVEPTSDACVWFIVLDGMRYDTWMRVVRPQLTERFEVKKEQAYFSILPSWTQIARTSLFAGQNPEHWRNYRNTFTDSQSLLAAKLLGLSENDKNTKLRFYSGMESDRTMEQLDKNVRYPYNLLVFNISDDNLHKERDNVATLNESVQMQLTNALNFLDGLIKPTDLVIFSSDHGFVEMDPEDGIPIPDEKGWEREMTGIRNPVAFRYIRSESVPPNLPQNDVFTFEYRTLRDGKFTVPIGKKWFKRAGSSNMDRYSHGGLSFAEMVVPGALMQLISVPRIEIVFSDLPSELQSEEGKTQRVVLRVRNQGNREGTYQLEARTDTETVSQIQQGVLKPGDDAQHAFSFKPVVRRDGSTTRFLQLILSYADVGGESRKITREILVLVRKRSDVVEISFGGLDDLDK